MCTLQGLYYTIHRVSQNLVLFHSKVNGNDNIDYLDEEEEDDVEECLGQHIKSG